MTNPKNGEAKVPARWRIQHKRAKDVSTMRGVSKKYQQMVADARTIWAVIEELGVAESELVSLRTRNEELEREIEGDIALIPADQVVIVRPGNGPQVNEATLAVSIARLAKNFVKGEAELALMRQPVSDEEQKRFGSIAHGYPAFSPAAVNALIAARSVKEATSDAPTT